MRKRIFAWLLCISMLIGSVPITTFADNGTTDALTDQPMELPLAPAEDAGSFGEEEAPNEEETPNEEEAYAAAAPGEPVLPVGETAIFVRVDIAAGAQKAASFIPGVFLNDCYTSEELTVTAEAPNLAASEFMFSGSGNAFAVNGNPIRLHTGAAPGSFRVEGEDFFPDFGGSDSVLLFRREPNGSDLPGYTRITNTSEITEGAYCLIAAVREGVLYVASADCGVQPAGTTVTVSPMRSGSFYRHVELSGLTCEALVLDQGITLPVQGYPIPMIDDPREIALDTNGNGAYQLTLPGSLIDAEIIWDGAAVAEIQRTASYPTARNFLSGSGYSGTEVTLRGCEYQFVSDGSGGYIASGKTADGTAVYLNIDGSHPGISDHQGHPNSKDAAHIVVSASPNGGVMIANAGSTDYLAYSKWDFFSCTHSTVTTNPIYLYQRCADGSYARIESPDAIISGGCYLVVAEITNQSSIDKNNPDKLTYKALRPAFTTTLDNRNIHTVGITGQYFPNAATDIVFTAARLGSAQVSIGTNVFHVTVTGSGLYTAGLHSVREQTQDVVLAVGSKKTMAMLPGLYTEEDIVWSQPGIASGTAYDMEKLVSYANLGTDQYYNGTEISAEECLYTLSGSADSCTLVSANGIYVHIAGADNVNAAFNGYPGSTSIKQQLRITSATPGIFHLQSAEGYLAFRRVGWNVFFTKGDLNNTTTANYTAADCDFLLYRPAQQEEISSQELPGYVRLWSADELRAGERYLIAAYYNGTLYLLHPATTNSRNAHVARANKTYSQGYTEFAFIGEHAGSTDATVGGTTYHITVLPKPTAAPNGSLQAVKGEAANKSVRRIILSKGFSYQVKYEGAKYWISADDTIASVAQDGTITAVSTGGADYGEVLVGCVDAEDKQHTVTVIVVDLGAVPGSERICDIYITDVIHTDAYYSFLRPGVTEYSAGDFHRVYGQDAVYLASPLSQPFGINFYAAAQEGYALTFMAATGSGGNYDSIMGTDARQTAFFQNGNATSNMKGIFGENVLAGSVQAAMNAMGCTGAMGFSRYAENLGFGSCIEFRSDSLPTISKKVLSIAPGGNHPAKPDELLVQGQIPYTDGMDVYAGDVVSFMVTVATKPAASRIDYSKLEITDLLPGAELVGYSLTAAGEAEEIIRTETFDERGVQISRDANNDIVANFKAALEQMTDEQIRSGVTIRLYISYTVTDEDITRIGEGGHLENTVRLEYQYASLYGSGTETGRASARAILTVKMSDRLKYVNLSLSGDIGANIYFAPSGENDKHYESWLSSTNPHSVVFEVGGVSRTVVPFRGGEDAVVNGTVCKRFGVGVAPQDISTPIVVYIQDANGDRVTEPLTFTVQRYAQAVLSGGEKLIHSWQVNGASYGYAVSSFADLSAMVKAMLNYGAYTQQYLGYHTERLANSILPEADRSIAPPENLGTSAVAVHNDADSGITFTGMALQLDSGSMSLRVYFNCDRSLVDLDELKAQSSFIGQSSGGALYMFTYAEGIHHDANGLFIRISNVSASWLSNTYKVAIRNRGRVSSVELTALSYVSLLLAGENTNPSLANMGCAMYAYNQAAQAYFRTVYPQVDLE